MFSFFCSYNPSTKYVLIFYSVYELCCISISEMYLSFLSAAVVQCVEIADAEGFNAIVLSCFGDVQSTNCSFDDGRPPIVPCEYSHLSSLAYSNLETYL